MSNATVQHSSSELRSEDVLKHNNFPVSGMLFANFLVSRTHSGNFPVSRICYGNYFLFYRTHSRIPFWKDAENGSSETFSIMEIEKISGKIPDGNWKWNSGGNPISN